MLDEAGTIFYGVVTEFFFFFWFLFTLLCTGCPGWLTSKILWSHDNEYVFSLNASTKFYKQSYDLKEIKNFNICFNIINSSVLEVTDISDKLSSAALMRLCVWHPQNACHRHLMTCSFVFSGSVERLQDAAVSRGFCPHCWRCLTTPSLYAFLQSSVIRFFFLVGFSWRLNRCNPRLKIIKWDWICWGA